MTKEPDTKTLPELSDEFRTNAGILASSDRAVDKILSNLLLRIWHCIANRGDIGGLPQQIGKRLGRKTAAIQNLSVADYKELVCGVRRVLAALEQTGEFGEELALIKVPKHPKSDVSLAIETESAQDEPDLFAGADLGIVRVPDINLQHRRPSFGKGKRGMELRHGPQGGPV